MLTICVISFLMKILWIISRKINDLCAIGGEALGENLRGDSVLGRQDSNALGL